MLDINLASRIYLDHSKISKALWVASLSIALLLVSNLWQIFSDTQELSSLRSSLQAKVTGPGGRTVSEKEFSELTARINRMNSIITTRNKDWLILLDRLEQVIPDGVMLTEITADSQTKGYKFSGQALDFKKVRQVYEAMGSGELFTDVFLVSQSRLRVSDLQRGVAFTLTARVKQ